MKKWIVLSIVVMAIAGCASVKAIKSDIQTGFTAPPQAGEVLPQEQGSAARDVVGSLPIPFANTAAPLVGGLVTLFAAWQRGRQIRKGQEPSVNPITGFLGNKTGVESVVQNVSTVSQGITEFFKEGSSAQHAWQGILTGLVGVAGTAFAVPQVGAIVSAHPEIYAWVGGIAGLANAVQQWLANVKPVEAIK